MREIIIYDVTLRDGNHAVDHQISDKQLTEYIKNAQKAKVPFIELGHGNGLGASSLQIGKCLLDDNTMLKSANEYSHFAKLGVHVIPGFATIQKDIIPAMQNGVEIFRIASHCSEADITQRHIEFVRSKQKMAFGILMMSHLISQGDLVEQALKMESYGAQVITIMDSAGTYLPEDVTNRILALKNALNIPVGFHGHNNLGLGIANSIAAIKAGATYLDAASCGFGAGSGNTQLEMLVLVLKKMGYKTSIDPFAVLNLAIFTKNNLLKETPFSDALSVATGIAGLFSGFKRHIIKAAKEYDIDPIDLIYKLGEKKVIAGQEDTIIEVAKNLQKQAIYAK